jgi:curved DNA-binding protein CbpA
MDFKEIDKARRNLELGETASLKEIRDSYRRLSLKYHPDRRQSDATEENIEKFKIITEAYNLTELCT